MQTPMAVVNKNKKCKEFRLLISPDQSFEEEHKGVIISESIYS